MKYLWIVMLIVGEIAWIYAMIKELKENKEFHEEIYHEKIGHWENFCDCFDEISFTFFFALTHTMAIFIISLMMYTIKQKARLLRRLDVKRLIILTKNY